jgi:multiple antibiotic resistance protein
MEIDLDAFQIAGSIVLFLFALTMVFGEPKAEAEEKEIVTSDVDRSIYPLAIPSIAGPGSMLAVVSLTDNSKFNVYEQAETVAQMAVILLITLVLMLMASRIIKIIGEAGGHGAHSRQRGRERYCPRHQAGIQPRALGCLHGRAVG